MADIPKAQGRQFGFHGREKEFAWLRGMFDAVATKDSDGKYTGPRMAVIVAESGIGKSRLVQELYIRLTNDPKWDPPEFDYWPEAFGDGGVNLRAVPDMRGHVPKGPPRFAWLGARWQSPEERNALERRSVLPELRSSVMVHAEIMKSHGSAWAHAASRVSESVRKDGVGDAIGAVADLVGIPFFGLVSKIAKGTMDLAADRMAGPKSFGKAEQEENKGEVDEVLECMRLLLNGSGAVPTVLWLDDAQWIDAETQSFLHRLWKEAERRKWPLLIAVTHWEREWRQLAIAERQGEASDTLHDFVGRDGVEMRVIDCAGTDALRAILLERLPGLTAAQQLLLVEKAGGNFLTMMENIGELLRQPANFVDRDIRAALSPAGERKVEKWESLREKRVEQRFGELEPEVQDLLGWSSHLGQRFLRDVVVEFASEAAKVREAPVLIERCVDPYVILGRSGENTREFRDKAFHAVAARHFENYGDEHREALSAVLRRHLVEWVNNSFDAEGNEIWPDIDKGVAAPEQSATGLSQEERRDLLGMAMRELPLPGQPDWTSSEHVAALRAVYLLILTDARDRLWGSVGTACAQLSAFCGGSLPECVLTQDNRLRLFHIAQDAGSQPLAVSIGRGVFAAVSSGDPQDAAMLCGFGTIDFVLDFAIALNAQGDTDQALFVCAEAERRARAAFATTERVEDSIRLVHSLILRAESLRLKREFDDSSAASLQAEAAACEYSVRFPANLRLVALRCEALRGLALMGTEEHPWLLSLPRYQEIVELVREAQARSGSPVLRGALFHGLCGVASCRLSRLAEGAAESVECETDEIAEVISEAKVVAQSCVEESDAFHEREKLAAAYGLDGEFLLSLGRHEEAVAALEVAAEVALTCCELFESVAAERLAIECVSFLADAEEQCGREEEAMFDFEWALELAESLAERVSSPANLKQLTERLHDLGAALGRRGRVSEAVPALVKCCDVARALYLHPQSSFGDAEHFLSVLNMTASAAIEAQEFAVALVHARQFLEESEKVAALLEMSYPLQGRLGLASTALRCEIELGDLNEAQLSASAVIELIDRLQSVAGGSSDVAEEELDSAAHFLCADGIDLVARLRGIQGDAMAEQEARTRAADFRARAAALKAEEDAVEEEAGDYEDDEKKS